MRVSNRMMLDSVIKNINKNEEKLFNAQKKVATGKKLTLPSENPVKMGQVLGFNKTLSMIGQYEKNIATGKSRFQIIEPTLESVDELLREAKQLAIDLSSGNIDEPTREYSLKALENIYNQLMDYANTKDGDQYIFSGHQTKTAPYSSDVDFNATWHGDTGDVRIIIGQNKDISLNNNGQKAFEVNGTEFFDMLRDLRSGIQTDDQTLISDQIDALASAIDHVKGVRIDSSVKYNQLKSVEDKLSQLKINIENLKSNITDANMSEAVIELQAQQTAYEVSLASSARIVQTSLLDFLR